jgi:murein DD-endopeptidase MepM/ murein hydrolase activator NlpD
MISPLRLCLLSTVVYLLIPGFGATANQIAQTENPQTSGISDCPLPALSRMQKHRIVAGETLETIAAQYNLIPATLMGINPVLRQRNAPVGAEILIPPYNGIRVDIPAGETWQDVAEKYNLRPDVLFEVNGCQANPRVVFVPGVNWSPINSAASASQVVRQGVLGGFPLPTQSEELLGYGWRLKPTSSEVAFHSGVDLQAAVGTPVLTVGDGVVAFADSRGPYGNLVVINHANGKQTRYAHLELMSVKPGQQVKKGEQIGTVGTTGSPDVQEPHLHFEVRSNSDLGWVAEDPQLYLHLAEVGDR